MASLIGYDDVSRASRHGTAPAIPDDKPRARTQIEQAVADMIARDGAAAFSWQYHLAKRALDVVISTVSLILLVPIILIIAASIKLDSSGPVFFVQERPGYLGRPFRMLKFRTMRVGSDREGDTAGNKRPDDPRVTAVGKLMRRTSLDELPQLINVLCGDMSLVGPRPEITQWVHDHYETWQYRRFLAPQGISGWWQVTGRSNKSLREKTQDDLFYVVNASFWLDVKILLMTIRAIVRRDGAF